jgi:hypothetical protein
MVNKKNQSRFARCRQITEREVGRPVNHLPLRKNPIIAGQLEYLVQPIYDFYGVAVATAVTKQSLFAQPIGASYTPAGGSAYVKTLYHTNLVQPGMLDAPKKMLVKAVSVIVRPDIAPQDLASFVGQTLLSFWISGKDYLDSLVSKCPGGAGGFSQNTSTASTESSNGTMSNLGANGWPTASNVSPIVDDFPQVPGLPPMDPILGQLIEQQQNFYVVLDPTITGSAAFTTLAAAPTSLFIGNGINSHVYLEGVLMRAVL